MSPFETYQTYLSMKSHFTNSKYDFFKYGGKSRATVTSFNKRKDKYWFEKTSRKYSDKEVQNEKKLLSYKIIPDDNDNIRLYSTLGYNGEIKTFSPEEVISNLLIKLKHLASNYLKKPIMAGELLIRIRKLLAYKTSKALFVTKRK